METGEIGWGYDHSILLLMRTSLSILDSGVAVGAGEIEERTIEELEDTKSELKQVKAQLTESIEENALLRMELQQLRGSWLENVTIIIVKGPLSNSNSDMY